MKLSGGIVAAMLAFSPRVARATECTHELVVSAIGVLEHVASEGENFGFPRDPGAVASIGPTAGIPYIETFSQGGLDLMRAGILDSRHQLDAITPAENGQCGEPLSDEERALVDDLRSRFEPWVSAWEAALPLEYARRSSDRSAAAPICELLIDIENTRATIGREKRKPGGVVDVELMHRNGQLLLALNDTVANRERLFLRDRKRAFAPALCMPDAPKR